MANITTNHAIMYTNSVKITLNSENASLCNILLLAGTWRVKQVLSVNDGWPNLLTECVTNKI